MSGITVIKCNHRGGEVFRWKAKLIERGDSHMTIEAFFELENHFLGEIALEVGDRFLETYYSNRWYNLYEVHAKGDDHLKCWYCNLSYPAVIEDNLISFRDLALDFLVLPDGGQQLVDEDEFADLEIPIEDRQMVLKAVDELRSRFQNQLAK